MMKHLEFAPCADTIYNMRRDAEGHVEGDESLVTIRTGAKLRPVVASVYTGGNATR